jgi:hypothetical protein
MISNQVELVREYMSKAAAAAKAREAGNYKLTQAFEQQALDRLNAMDAATRAFVLQQK